MTFFIYYHEKTIFFIDGSSYCRFAIDQEFEETTPMRADTFKVYVTLLEIKFRTTVDTLQFSKCYPNSYK
jgi:hypothetical protein